ncbi:MAG: carbohydrate binding domain-containing protein [bacterium]
MNRLRTRFHCIAATFVLFVSGMAAAVFGETLENRDGNSLIAVWWGSDPVAPYVYTMDFGNTQYVHSAPFSLKIDFNKLNDLNPYSFISAMGRWNFQNFDYLSFWVRNNGSPLKIRIRLEDRNGNPWESNWADIEPETKTTNADWENLVVDLTRTFAATNVDFTGIEQIMFLVAPGIGTTNGTFWLDDVDLTRSPHGAPLETFESDLFGWSGGGVFTNMTNTTEQFQNNGAPTDLGQKSMKIAWESKSTNYDNFIYSPLHDSIAPVSRIGRYTNLTLNGNDTLDVWVKSSTDNNMPILLKFTGKKDTADVGTVNYTGEGDWQKLSWKFAERSEVAEKLQIVWIFPYPGLFDDGGTMYIDNLGLSGGTGPSIPLAPTNFVTTAAVPDGNGIYTVKWASVSGVSGYVLQESTNINFKTFTTTNVTTTSRRIVKTVTSFGKTYYYRVCSRIVADDVTNSGSFAAALPVTVKRIPTARRTYELLENFDGASLISTWWGSDPTEPYVYTMDFGNTQKSHKGSKALRVDFNKANETNAPYSFFSAMGLFNMKNYDYLSFWVYNSGTPLSIRIRIEDSRGKAWESNLADIEPCTKTAAADWENLVVDLTRSFHAQGFGDINMAEIVQIMFIVAPGDTTASGTFWMDDVALHRAPNSAPLDIFESDLYGWMAGAPFVIGIVSNQFRNDDTVAGLGQQSMQIIWTNKLKDYANLVYMPGYDTNIAPVGRIGNYRNFRLNTNGFVELWLKSTTDNGLPILLKLDDLDVSIQTYTGSGAWQRLTWDYSGVPGATNVTCMYLYPYPNQADDGGTMYIDDLNLIGGGQPAIPGVPTGVVCSTVVNGGCYTMSWASVSGSVAYEVQEGPDVGFSTITRYVVTGTNLMVKKEPSSEPVTYFYRVHAGIREGAVTNFGTCGKPVSVELK